MDLRESQKLAKIYLNELDREPVGVKFYYTKEAYDAVDCPTRSTRITYCNSINLASRDQPLKLTAAHQACGNGAFALNFKDAPDPIASGVGRHKKGIYDRVEVSKTVHETMQFLPNRPYGYMAAPLHYFSEDPDVVVVVSTSYNIMRLIQGYGYKHGYSPQLKTVGLQAVCHDITTLPIQEEGINVTFLCPGTRQVADWEYNELGVGIAFSKWYDTIEGVVATTNPFARNPIKREIVRKLEEAGMDSGHIRFNDNYDTGTYVGGKVEQED